MPIAIKTAAALLAIFLALFVGAWVIVENAVQPGFEQLETQAHARDRARAQAFLQSRERDLEARATDYAHWDDTYAFFGGGRPSFLIENFPDDWFANYGVDLLAFADERGRILWTRSRQEDGAMTSNPAATESVLADARAASADGNVTRGVVWSDDGPYLYAAARATRTDGAGSPRGYVILARRLSSRALNNQVQLDLTLLSAASPPADLADHVAALGSGAPETWTEDNITRSLIPLNSASGRLVGAMLMERPRDLAALGKRSMDLAVALFALMTALGLGALWFLLQRLVIHRLVKLEQHLHAQSGVLAPHIASPSNDEIGRLTSAYNALADRLQQSAVRERRAVLERETEAAANRMKSDFLANLSHQLRTPLDSILGYAELVEEELADLGVKAADLDLQNVRTSARQLLVLVNEILDLAKIEAGRLEIQPQAFVVEEMLHAAIEATRPIARERDVKFTIRTASDLGVAHSDEQRLRQCLINLLAHACGAARHGHVSFTAARVSEGDMSALRFEVRDDGPAMSAAEVERAFEPFAQVASAGYRHGADLGLAVTAKLATLIGGDVTLTSVEGEGSTFVLTIPVNVGDTPALQAA